MRDIRKSYKSTESNNARVRTIVLGEIALRQLVDARARFMAVAHVLRQILVNVTPEVIVVDRAQFAHTIDLTGLAQ